MAITTFLFNRKPPPKIVTPLYDGDGKLVSTTTSLKFDCAIEENHSIKNTVTAFPIEDGLDITDHIKQDPDRLKITGFVTNSPVKYLAFNLTTSSPVQSAYDTLLLLTGRKNTKLATEIQSYSAPVVVDIFTTLRCWLNMVVESIDIPRQKDTGDALEFSMTLVSIRKVKTKYANVNYTDGKRYGAGGAGEQETDKVAAGEKATVKPAPRTDSALLIGSKQGAGSAAFQKAALNAISGGLLGK